MKYYYKTVVQALSELKNQGFDVDFNLRKNLKRFKTGEWDISDFKISSVYRYEGDTDPADEAVVYAIESTSGIKGVIVSGYGMSSGNEITSLLEKLVPNTKIN
jgi:hypothetical protein